MKYKRLKFENPTSFDSCFGAAKKIIESEDTPVSFLFNGIECFIDEKSEFESSFDAYHESHKKLCREKLDAPIIEFHYKSNLLFELSENDYLRLGENSIVNHDGEDFRISKKTYAIENDRIFKIILSLSRCINI